MSVKTRTVSSVALGGSAMVGAVSTDEMTCVACPAKMSAAVARDLFGTRLKGLAFAGRGLFARLTPGGEGDVAEPNLLADCNVLLAVRNGETPEATADWLTFYGTHHDADAALIVDRDPPGLGNFADQLQNLSPSLHVVVVGFDTPLGLVNAPDARHPALAPAPPKRDLPDNDPWHSPLGEHTIFELLRHQFLSRSRSIAALDIGDVVLDRAPLFDHVAANSEKAVLLRGMESYPWRLRQGKPASFGDHIAVRSGERRRVISWALSPTHVPDGAILRPWRAPHRMPVREEPLRFSRAMGVVFPGVPVNALVRKSELVEDAKLIDFATKTLGASPIRLPAPEVIPSRPETQRVTVVTAMKNEGPFVLDWIAHNRAIGIDQHLVYTNDCEDGTDRLLDLLKEAGVTRRDNPFRRLGKVPQHAAFRAAEDETVVQDADWLLTLDVDEYINIHAGDGRLADLLAAVPEAHVISMPWRLFGNADIHAYQDRPVTQQFQRAAPAFAPRPIQAWAFKSLFRNAGLFRRLGVHRPKGLKSAYLTQLSWVDGSGRPLSHAVWRQAWRMSKQHWGYDLVSLNHYAVRSAESFLVKRERGRVNHTTRAQDASYWFRMNHNAEAETSIQRLVPAAEAEKTKLMQLPGVAAAHAEAVEWHQNRIKALRAQPDGAGFYAEITSDRMQRLSRMATNFGMAVQMAGPHVIPDDVAARDPNVPFFYTVEDTG